MSRKLPSLNNSQVLFLQVLQSAQDDGLNKEQIAKKAGVAPGIDTLGPVDSSLLSRYPGSLYAYGLVTPEVHPDESATLWRITEKGSELLPQYRARKRSNGDKIPAKMLDSAVLKIKPLRPYGLELYTEEDLREIRSYCDGDYEAVPLSSLRQQICNRRKQGAFADPAEKGKKAAESAIRNFGPEGTIIKGLLTEDQLKKLSNL